MTSTFLPLVRRTRSAFLAGSALVLGAAPVLAAPRALPNRFEAGSDVNRDPCTATRSWSFGKDLLQERDQPFVITCRGSAEQRGWIDIAQEKPVIAPELCGEAVQTTLAPIGPATLRRCFDPRFSGETIVVEQGGIRGSAMGGALAPLLVAMRSVRTGAVATDPVTVDAAAITAVPAPPASAQAARGAAAITSGGLDVQSAIAQGLAAIYAGRNVEASRLLNDSIAQFTEASPLQRAELRLDAGLADSNIGEFASAEARFASADALLAAAPPSPVRSRLLDQASAYRALHYYNQGAWQKVLDELAGARSTQAPLSDTATLAQLNSSSSNDMRLGLDTDQINQLILVAQKGVTQSVAYLRLGRFDDAEAALIQARVRGVDPAQEALGDGGGASGSLNWLRARLERQQGRIRLAKGDTAGALRSFNCALATMHAVPLPAGEVCLFPDDPGRRGVPLAGPAIADAELERTAVLARQPGVDRAQVMARYEEAVTTLAGQSEGGFVVSPLLAPYLDMLAADAKAGDRGAAERFFAALQTVREPGVARELAALQAQVSSGASGALVRERQELERRRGQLRYEATTLPADAPRQAEIRAESGEVAARLDRLSQELSQSGAASAIDEKAATLGELQAALRPGEVYLKVSAVGDRLFGAAVSRDAVTVYPLQGSAGKTLALANKVLRTAKAAEGRDGSLRIRPFASASAYDLFGNVAGPAADRLRSATAVIADTGTTLGALPVAILVTQPVTTATVASADYGRVPFLVRSAEVASALSPRAFMRVRTSLAPSRAPEKLIGFGAHALPPENVPPAVAETPVPISASCSIPYGVWAASALRTYPIPVDEIRAGAIALDDAGAPIVTGTDFTNAAVIAASDKGRLERFQVIHFATHGSPAVQIPGCETPLPPALATTVIPPTPGAPNRSNGILSFMDIAKLHLDANLVILSACDTASGIDTETGRAAGLDESATLDGLVRAFIIAQARAVLATYWKVPAQRGTEELIKDFYVAGRGGTMGQALRQAQMTVMANSQTSHPFFWAAFFLVGDGAKSMLTAPARVASR